MNYKGVKDVVYACQHCGVEFKFKGHSYNNKFCSLLCTNASKAKAKEELTNQRYNDWLNGVKLDRKNPRPLIREYLIRRDGYKCSCCGISEWNGKELTLWADHIDGDASNDHPSNYRLICPNCDSQSPTFGAKNYGNGRKSRGMPQYG